MLDPYNLQRFISAQDPIHSQVLMELEMGEKQTHWMWFVFPQIHGLGQSELAKRYAISSSVEAIAYLEHPILGQRLERCCQIVSALTGKSVHQIFGHTDALKLHSSMTLFASFTDKKSVFRSVIDKYYDGTPDQVSLKILR